MAQIKPILVFGSMFASVVLAPALAAPAKKTDAKPAQAAVKQVVTGPVEKYWVSSATTSGMGLGTGKPSMGAMVNMLGGGDTVGHTLNLRLGSSQAASGEPAATHLPPPGLKVKELPLYWQATPTGPATPVEEHEQKAY